MSKIIGIDNIYLAILYCNKLYLSFSMIPTITNIFHFYFFGRLANIFYIVGIIENIKYSLLQYESANII
jgi:hypothetical protein